MLYGYPRKAAKDNWVHDAIVAALAEVHARVEGGKRMPAWPNIFGVGVRNKFKGKKKLKSLIGDYRKVLLKLSAEERKLIREAIGEQNQLGSLFACAADCRQLEELPKDIAPAVAELFQYMFLLLTDFSVRDRQYEVIHEEMPSPTCPFCGIEYLDAPVERREALDHYLARSRYPYAAVNLRNLVPMCGKCNKIKADQDVLRTGSGGSRRVIFDPYAAKGVTVNLKESEAFIRRARGWPTHRWVVSFEPHCDMVESWDAVFEVRRRYRENVLDRSYRRWLGAFCEGVGRKFPDSVTPETIRRELDEYILDLEVKSLTGYESLQRPFFEWVRVAVRDDSAELMLQMQDLAEQR